LPQARAGEAETIAAVNAAAALDDAFERQSAEEIKRMMTADHIAVSSYYGAPQTVAEQIASLPELKYEQTIVGAVKVDEPIYIRTFRGIAENRFDDAFLN